MKKSRLIAISLLLSITAGIAAYYAIDRYIVAKATQNIRDILLSHRGVHIYIQRTMHPEFYRALGSHEIDQKYYAPEILSSTFMVRVLHQYYNEERKKDGLPPVYYKMAALNPRNPVNKADAEEKRLLDYFRGNPGAQEYEKVTDIGGKHYLVFAMPFLKNEKQCMVCHGRREDAPIGLQARYPGQAGFNEKIGDLRAIESVRIPIDREMNSVYGISLALLAGFISMSTLFVFNRKLTVSIKEKTSELSSKEATYRKLLEAADAIPFEYNLARDQYTYVGKQFRKIMGEDPSDLKSFADWQQFVHPDDRETKLKACRETLMANRDSSCRLRLLKKDGSSLVVHQNVKIAKNEESEPLAVGFIHDVTSIARTNAIQKARLKIADAAIALDLDDLIRVLVDEAEALTESSIAFFHFINENRQTILLQQWSAKTMAVCNASGKGNHYPVEKAGIWADSLRTGNVVIHNDYNSVEGKKGLPEGHVPLVRELVAPVMHGEQMVAVIGVGNKKVPYDDSDVKSIRELASFGVEIILRKKAEEESRSFQAQLLQSQKVESIGRLAGGVAHDFNNMLGVILGHTDLLLGSAPEGSSLKDELIEIKEAAQRSASITKQLLAFARKQIARPEIIDLNDAVDGMLKMLRRLIGEDIDLVWKPKSELPKVFIDPSQVDQVLANLATNSRDAISGVGKITIETDVVEVDEDYCRIHAEFRAGRYVLLAVSDSGRGISKEILQNIFEPFFTTKGTGKGTGLGLATVYGIVKQNGGCINVYSEPEGGTTFKIYLPAREPREKAETAAPAAAENLKGTETILLVEDERPILRLAAMVLRGFGYSVLEAGTPAEAIKLSSEHQAEISLLVTDVVMPGMNGKDLADYLQKLRPAMKCLYISGYTANVIVHRGILDEGVNFIAKPFSPVELGSKVRAILDSGKEA